MNDKNESVRQHRARRASEGYRFFQISLGPTDVKRLDQICVKIHRKKQTSEIFQRALRLLHADLFRDDGS